MTGGGKNKNKRKINHFYFYFVLLKVRVGSPVIHFIKNKRPNFGANDIHVVLFLYLYAEKELHVLCLNTWNIYQFLLLHVGVKFVCFSLVFY